MTPSPLQRLSPQGGVNRGSLHYISLSQTSVAVSQDGNVHAETYRPCNLPPKNKVELEAHISEVRRLEHRFSKRLQQEAALRALKQLHREQEGYRLFVLNDLWLRRLIPELANRYTKGLPPGERIERIWRQGLPPGIRKVVWPLAIGNSLRITPELFEICSQKAAEVRALEVLTGARETESRRSNKFLYNPNKAPVDNGETSSIPISSSDSSSSSSSSSCESLPASDDRIFSSLKKDPVTMIRDSLVEILKNRELVCNREASIDCILPDVPRTFPSLPAFQTSGRLHASCLKLLEGWVCYRPDVGYVQGMSFLAALLLVHLDIFPAFVCLCNLLSSPSLLGMYRMEPYLISKRYHIFDELFERELPYLHNYMTHILCFPKEMYLLEWLLTLYSKSLSLPMASYVWDLYFLDGEVTLYITGVAIIKLISHHILPTKKRLETSPLKADQNNSYFRCEHYDKADTNDDDDVYDEKEIHHQLFERTRRALANVRSLITSPAILYEAMSTVKSHVPESLIEKIRSLGSVEFSAFIPTNQKV